MKDRQRIEFKDEWFHLSDEEAKSKKYEVPDPESKEKVPVE
jgi:hypothetical protein